MPCFAHNYERGCVYILPLICRKNMSGIASGSLPGISRAKGGRFKRKRAVERVKNLQQSLRQSRQTQSSGSETGINITGNRIVNLGYLIQQLRDGCCDCGASLHLKDYVSESKIGLASLLMLTCGE